jgi:hypothetical protein
MSEVLRGFILALLVALLCGCAVTGPTEPFRPEGSYSHGRP